MQIDPAARRVSLNAREFAEFRLGPQPLSAGRTGRWRTELGRTWHTRLQHEAAATAPTDMTVEHEVSIKGTWEIDGWQLDLQGRIDQVALLADGSGVLQEIKTVAQPLPTDPDELRQTYPAYCTQLAVYLHLAELRGLWEGRPLRGELVFVDIGEGLRQAVPLTDGPARLARQWEQWRPFLEDLRARRQAARALAWEPPFADLRPGQEHVEEALHRAAAGGQTVFFEAPTGFGKTGLALAFALRQLREGHLDRLIYLTSKSTGQWPVVQQLARMLGPAPEGLRYVHMRNRGEHSDGCPIAGCDPPRSCREELLERWEQAGGDPFGLFAGCAYGLTQAHAKARRLQVCPYELSRLVLPIADIWIGDYNYVFSPASRGLFLDQPGFSHRRTGLLIDEAHNLPSRVAQAHSFAWDVDAQEHLNGQLQIFGAPETLRRRGESFAIFLDGLEAADRLTEADAYELRDHVEGLAEFIESTPLPPDLLPPEVVDTLWQYGAWRQILGETGLERLPWSPKEGQLRVDCLDAASVIGAMLGLFGRKVLMSATLSPHGYMAAACGLAAETEGKTGTVRVEAPAPWRQGAYRLAVDTRVDTRWKQRARFHSLTAQTISRLTADSGRPVAVFFSSYRYAEDVAAALGEIDPFLRVAIPERGMDLAGQEAFIRESLRMAHALFLVLGTGFAEGIDLLGGEIERALVVGPALPEVNAVQEARREQLAAAGQSRSDAFYRTYVVPGMIKINQALGRLVRAPGHKAEIILHGKRFAEPGYRELLPEDFGDPARIDTELALEAWLRAAGP